MFELASVAQWIEQFRPKEKVVGSTPAWGTNYKLANLVRAILFSWAEYEPRELFGSHVVHHR